MVNVSRTLYRISVNLVLEHLEYLVRRHDCVTVPGIGAFIVRYRPAGFDSRNPSVLMPPSMELAFNAELSESDGLIERSVARRNGVSFEVARRIVAEEAESLLRQLRTFGSLTLGRLGELIVTEYGSLLFEPSMTSDWDCRFYGLRPLYLKNVEGLTRGAVVFPPPATLWEEEKEEHRSRRGGTLTRSLIGVAASLAVIVTLALFFLNPVKVENEPLKASMAPDIAVDVPSGDVDNPVKDGLVDAQVDARECESTTDVPLGVCEEESAPDDDIQEEYAPVAQQGEKRQLRFNDDDPFCVIVASFPESGQARRYIAENPGRSLGVLQQDGKFRVYAATGCTYDEAAAQKSLVGGEGIWICRR